MSIGKLFGPARLVVLVPLLLPSGVMTCKGACALLPDRVEAAAPASHCSHGSASAVSEETPPADQQCGCFGRSSSPHECYCADAVPAPGLSPQSLPDGDPSLRLWSKTPAASPSAPEAGGVFLLLAHSGNAPPDATSRPIYQRIALLRI